MLLGFVHLGGVELRVFFFANAVVQFKLGLQEIDMAFFVGQQLFEQLLRDEVTIGPTVLCRFPRGR